MAFSNRRISIAPMMEWTDRHYRYFMRLITKHTLLYTEMVTTNAILNGDKDYLIGFSQEEQPLALQIGGADPKEMAECAKIAQDFGYKEINLNVGCPSHRVQAGRFGASLIPYPELVAECVSEMKNKCSIDVTVKTRIGIEPNAEFENLLNFVEIVEKAGCNSFTVHARSAILSMTPKENREKPKLRYEVVYDLKKEKPNLEININGNIKTIEASKEHLNYVDGVMIGRVAYGNPYIFSQIDKEFFNDSSSYLERKEVAEKMMPYIEQQSNKGVPINYITRHMIGLYHGISGAKCWRRTLTKPKLTIEEYKELISKLP